MWSTSPVSFLEYLAIGLAVTAAILLTILGLRGRFGTARERGRFELNELLHSNEVPAQTRRREIATCRGHSLDAQALYGAGALWLTDAELGFALWSPRRHLRIPTETITSATATSEYHRVGIDEVSDEVDFLVVGWDTKVGPATVAFQVPDPEVWAEDILRAHV